MEFEGQRCRGFRFRWFILPFLQGNERCVDQDRMTPDNTCTFDFAVRTDNDFDLNRAD